MASVSGQSSGCCITPTGYRAQRGGTSAVQPLNLSQVSARGCYLLFEFSPVVTLWRTLLLAGLLNKAKWSSFCVDHLVFCACVIPACAVSLIWSVSALAMHCTTIHALDQILFRVSRPYITGALYCLPESRQRSHLSQLGLTLPVSRVWNISCLAMWSSDGIVRGTLFHFCSPFSHLKLWCSCGISMRFSCVWERVENTWRCKWKWSQCVHARFHTLRGLWRP